MMPRHITIRMDRHNREIHRRRDAEWLREKLLEAARQSRGGRVELDWRGVHGVNRSGMNAIVRLIQEILRRPGQGRLSFSLTNTNQRVAERARASMNRTPVAITHHPEPRPRRLYEQNRWWKG